MTVDLATILLQSLAILALVVSLVVVQRSHARLQRIHEHQQRRIAGQITALETEIERLDHRQRERDEEIRRRIRADNEARRRVLGAVRGETSR